MNRHYSLVDVFSDVPFRGNPVAVVLDSDGLTTAEMQRVAHWMNLSETTFVTPPTQAGADYGVRIFTPVDELPFAGHPTLGTCHAWVASGGTPAHDDHVVQQCAAGAITIRRTPQGWAFAGPPLLRSGPVDEETVDQLVDVLRLDREDVVDTQWVDNGPGWVALLLRSADAVLAVRPATIDRLVGIAGPLPAGGTEAFEVRAFFPKDGATIEDPVTGSLNASLAEWLLRTGRARAPYVVSQGSVLGRAGRVHVSADDDGTIWVGGGTTTCAEGRIDIGGLATDA